MLRLTDRIFEFETNGLSHDEALELFVDLLNTGLIQNLQGFYHRAAKGYLDSGAIVHDGESFVVNEELDNG
jgi:hypothetical protein